MHCGTHRLTAGFYNNVATSSKMLQARKSIAICLFSYRKSVQEDSCRSGVYDPWPKSEYPDHFDEELGLKELRACQSTLRMSTLSLENLGIANMDFDEIADMYSENVKEEQKG